ncbi:hypothetical protein IW140_003821 [Coemansia sp. RSA 1813]|nr:hypothetical protein EV178_004538 [Coemansia sp. RSA 1646]KAJ1769739.1 hypothetical protein LPJ74_003764 [Coemansia sp. RSA 1843]KAJ2090092.1 hypothetical protein IW138_002902 [Coemansia sp. RSA 986]KAJ2214167.1 hypothetical protein EV179_003187 [Coemansia sp. RSA 487]KAJ2568503.1 hypothetical protein IW140_003821 [Coemansia sp. RSA 1813]
MPPRFKKLYKQVPSAKEVRQRRLLQDAQLRRIHREQAFMGKRVRYRTTPQESETETEYEFTHSDTSELIEGLESKDHGERMQALGTLSTKLEQPSEELRQFITDGKCVDLLTAVLAGTDGDETAQALWCITNVAANESSQVSQCVLRTAPNVVPLLASGNVEIRNQAAWALGNLAAEGPDARDQLHANGALEALVRLAETETDPEVLQTVWFAVSNMARTSSTCFDALFELQVPQLVVRKMEAVGDNHACVAELAWVSAYLTAAGSTDRIDQFLETGAIDAFLQHSTALDDAQLIPVVRTLGNIAAGTDAQTHQLVDKPGFLDLLARCIGSSRAVEKEALWVLSNVTAGRKDDVEAVVGYASLVDSLVRIVEMQNFDIKKEAAFSLLNIAIVGGNVGVLPNARLVPEFVDFVRSQDEQLVRLGVQYIAVLFDQLPDRQGPDLVRSVDGAIDALETLVAVTDCDETRSVVSTLIDGYYGDATD